MTQLDQNDELARLIREVHDDRLATVDEEVFKRKLLPLAVARYSNVDYEIDLGHWQLVTNKAPTLPVKVTRNGKHLFTAPPLILSPSLEFKGSSLIEELKAAEKARQSGLVDREVMDSERLQPLLTVNNLNDAITCWMYIFAFYGIKLVPIDDKADDSTDTVKAITTSSSVEWDEEEDLL